MHVVAVSDLHGHLPEIPPCDLLLIAGDILPMDDYDRAAQAVWLHTVFRPWLAAQPARHIVGIAGNHDFVFEQPGGPTDLPWTYLQDSGTEIEGFKIWGSPWSLWYHDWAFNLYEPQLQNRWALIPDDTDILLVHGPPYGYGDRTMRGFSAGSLSLRERIENIGPRLVVWGHIHEANGAWQWGETLLANVSYLNHVRQPVFGLRHFDLQKPGSVSWADRSTVSPPGSSNAANLTPSSRTGRSGA
jgi:predicted phosphodiesterase